MPRFYETTLSITNLHNLSISTHVNRSRMQSKRRRLKEPYVVKIRSILCIFSPFGRIVYERKTTSSSVHVSNIKKFFSWQIIPFLDFLQDVSCLCKREVGTPAFFLKFQAFIQKFSGRIFPSSDHFFYLCSR